MSGTGISGIGSGIAWDTYIAAIRQKEEEALGRTIVVRQVRKSQQSQVLQQAKTLLENLKSKVLGFSVASNFKVKTVTSSESGVVTGVADGSAVVQTHQIRVDRLATNEKWTYEFTGVNDVVSAGGGTLEFTLRGETKSIEVDAGMTLNQLATKINSLGLGVTAAVYDTGSGSPSARLTIMDNKSGKFNPDQTAGMNFNFENFNSTGLEADFQLMDGGTAPTVEGQDALIYLNNAAAVADPGDEIYSDTNTVTDVIPGVTLTLNSVSLSETPDISDWITLTVGETTQNASAKIQDFIKAYNDVVTFLRQATKVNLAEEKQSNPTAGDPTLRSVLAQLQSAVTSVVATLPPDNAIRSVADLGISTAAYQAGQDLTGTLNFDSSKFEKALKENYEDLIKFFEGATIDGQKYAGFASKIEEVLKTFTNSTSGAVTKKIDTLRGEILNLDEDYQRKMARILAREERLKAQFARLEKTLGQLSGQSSALNQALNAIALNNQAIANRK